MNYSLSMTFLNTAGDKVSMSVAEVKENLDNATVSNLMDLIIAKNIFTSKGGDLVSKYSAKITEQEVTTIDIKDLDKE